MEILLERLTENNAEKLFQFEQENRVFFETMVPSRGDEYYLYETFLNRHHEILEEQKIGSCQFYLIMDCTGLILGRVNLVGIDRENVSAHIGYRVGERYLGKGVAKQAVAKMLEEAKNQQLRTIYAKTTSNNLASQKVLKKNSFQLISKDQKEVEFNGEMIQFFHYQWK
ncbi:GNAT family N-acetyltransferase [Anaerobacillus sp. CMMVII]|uniref:GNAT family N-acetyltransferase n=1 Tax=Anaerobacillus sp. CMMVII TaxID=2755588 RepID=UPI0021B7EE98|nr:GNAT family N-acetyltransferase [Anaerobacillus sp. CMMVII]MCT8138317.1 GNAT family N-acetyltransferase [Anaerobacillus sp. CMMVII]